MEKFPIEFKRGEQFAFTLYYVDDNGIQFSESSPSAQFTVKQGYDDISASVTLTIANGGIVYNALLGSFTVKIPASTTAALEWKKGVYDMWIQSNANGKDYVLDGPVTVLPNVG